MTQTATRLPTVLWAQTKSQVFLTIDLSDIPAEHSLVLGSEKVDFSAVKEGITYCFSIDLCSKVNEKVLGFEIIQRNGQLL